MGDSASIAVQQGRDLVLTSLAQTAADTVWAQESELVFLMGKDAPTGVKVWSLKDLDILQGHHLACWVYM